MTRHIMLLAIVAFLVSACAVGGRYGSDNANHPPSGASSCAAAELASFPWPSPPQPSGEAIVPPYLLFGKDEKVAELSVVAARLQGAISRAGYRQPRYLAAGCNGFAIVLDLEHIEDDGTRLSGSAGFASPTQRDAFSLAVYIERLFYAPTGHYRQIVMVVSDERIGLSRAAPTSAQLRAIVRGGVSSIPTALGAVPFTSKYDIRALVYEFDKGSANGQVEVIPPSGRLEATVHLLKAKLF